jgi:hypothetical protein
MTKHNSIFLIFNIQYSGSNGLRETENENLKGKKMRESRETGKAE